MAAIEIKGSVYQDKIDAFERALILLRDAMNIIRDQTPNTKRATLNPLFYDAWFEAESNCSATICDISSVIGELVREDMENTYL